jgi:hypothetical protein
MFWKKPCNAANAKNKIGVTILRQTAHENLNGWTEHFGIYVHRKPTITLL